MQSNKWATIYGCEPIAELYDRDFALVKAYMRKPSRRFSDPKDFPENIQAMMNNYSVRSQIDKAAGIGPEITRYVEA